MPERPESGFQREPQARPSCLAPPAGGEPDSLQDALGRAFREAYGADAVEREVCLSSGRICDFVMTLPVVGTRFAVEVEHHPDPGSVAGDAIHGAGQAMLYAAELNNVHPLVVVNPAERDDLDLSALRERVPVVEWSAEEIGA